MCTGGFDIITNRISTRSKRKLLWIIAILSFIMSAILDNLTTSIVMIMLLRKLVSDQHERWIYGGVIIIAANSGGAFSPIGDVTTIMLWVRGNVTTSGLVPNLIIPSILSMLLPILFASRMLHGTLPEHIEGGTLPDGENKKEGLLPSQIITEKERLHILIFGTGVLLFVPIFKSITHLPPFIGILLGLGFLWVYTEILYHRKKEVPESSKARISKVLGRIDFSTILFFLGILMAVSALQCILGDFAQLMRDEVGNPYIINIVIGVFWMFLAYCAGVGGSLLIIGSAAGVVVMGLEKINFIWYLKKFSLVALSGYLAGAGWYYVQEAIIRPAMGW
jgi:Na+/H+ antiporter NhaD/arsenite permease-like protein